MSDHEALSQAWAEYSQGAPPDPCHHFIMGWRYAEANAASRECVWTGFSTHGRIHYRTCRGVLNYTEMPRLQFIPYCPACGGRVKIQPQTNEEQ